MWRHFTVIIHNFYAATKALCSMYPLEKGRICDLIFTEQYFQLESIPVTATILLKCALEDSLSGEGYWDWPGALGPRTGGMSVWIFIHEVIVRQVGVLGVWEHNWIVVS